MLFLFCSPIANPSKIRPTSKIILSNEAAQIKAPIVKTTDARIIIRFLPKKSDPVPESKEPIAATPKFEEKLNKSNKLNY